MRRQRVGRHSQLARQRVGRQALRLVSRQQAKRVEPRRLRQGCKTGEAGFFIHISRD
jgi:hypothetical protein